MSARAIVQCHWYSGSSDTVAAFLSALFMERCWCNRGVCLFCIWVLKCMIRFRHWRLQLLRKIVFDSYTESFVVCALSSIVVHFRLLHIECFPLTFTITEDWLSLEMRKRSQRKNSSERCIDLRVRCLCVISLHTRRTEDYEGLTVFFFVIVLWE